MLCVCDHMQVSWHWGGVYKQSLLKVKLLKKKLITFIITIIIIIHLVRVGHGRHGGLIVSVLISGASGPGSSPGRGHCVVVLGKTLHSHSAPLSTQMYKWVPANCWGKPNKLQGE